MNQPLEGLKYMSVFAVNHEKMHKKSLPGNIYAVGIITPQISLNYYKICQNNYAKHPTTHLCYSIFLIPNCLSLLPFTMFLCKYLLIFVYKETAIVPSFQRNSLHFFSTSGK